jgi:hypothetical protein
MVRRSIGGCNILPTVTWTALIQLPAETDSQSDTLYSEPSNTCGRADHGSHVSSRPPMSPPPAPALLKAIRYSLLIGLGRQVRGLGRCRALFQLRRLTAEYDPLQWIRHPFPSAAADAGRRIDAGCRQKIPPSHYRMCLVLLLQQLSVTGWLLAGVVIDDDNDEEAYILY